MLAVFDPLQAAGRGEGRRPPFTDPAPPRSGDAGGKQAASVLSLGSHRAHLDSGAAATRRSRPHWHPLLRQLLALQALPSAHSSLPCHPQPFLPLLVRSRRVRTAADPSRLPPLTRPRMALTPDPGRRGGRPTAAKRGPRSPSTEGSGTTGRLPAQATRPTRVAVPGGAGELRFALRSWCLFQHAPGHPHSGSERSTRRADTGPLHQLGERTRTEPHGPTPLPGASPQGSGSPSGGDSTWALPGQKRGSAPGAGAGPGTQGTDCPASGRHAPLHCKSRKREPAARAGSSPDPARSLRRPLTFSSPTQTRRLRGNSEITGFGLGSQPVSVMQVGKLPLPVKTTTEAAKGEASCSAGARE